MNVYIRKKDLDYSAMRGPCPEGFHVPHYKEWQAIINIWLELGLPEQDGELYATYLKLPFAGERGSSGTLTDQTQLGYYWSSPSNDDSFFFWIGHYDDPTATTFGWRAVARSLRAFKDVPAKPDSSWTVIYDGSAVAAGAGIFWNATLGLISLSSDGFSRKTIQDKNLGATNVGDYGSHFQRGNNYGFPSSGTLSDTSATQVDASGYGPGNYYSSSTYITGSEDWSSVRNDNLWGHQTGAAPIMTTMKNAYIGQVYEYSYTFKGKTATEIGNEFDVLVGGIYTNSNGLTGGSNTECRIKKDIPSLANAKKITISGTVVGQNKATTAGALSIGKGTSRGTGAVDYLVFGSTYNGMKVHISYNSSSYDGNSVGNATGSTYKPTLIIDLEQKTITGTMSGFNNSTLSLTDAQVNDIRTYEYLCCYTSLNTSSISDVSIIIEY